jgi:hypothetical protein
MKTKKGKRTAHFAVTAAVKTVSKEAVKAVSDRTGNGSSEKYGLAAEHPVVDVRERLADVPFGSRLL